MSVQDIPDVQKAWLSTQQGKPAASLKLMTDWPVPDKLKANEVLVKVQAGALNPVGWKLMKVLPNFIAHRPHVVEHDLAGVIADSNGTHFKNGDEVFGWIPPPLTMKTRQGVLAQYTRVPADHLVVRPPNVTPVQAAGLSVAGLTAYHALHDLAQIEADQTVFINGGSSAVGAFAIQIAKAAGAKVTATASEKNEVFVRSLGADEFIDYTKVVLPKYLVEQAPSPKFNVIFDAVGLADPTLYTSSEAYLAPNGTFVTAGPLPQNFSGAELWNMLRSIRAIITPWWLGGTKRTYKFFTLVNKPESLKAFQKLVADGLVKPIVDSVFDFDDVPEAYNRMMTNRAAGKVVIRVDSATCE